MTLAEFNALTKDDAVARINDDGTEGELFWVAGVNRAPDGRRIVHLENADGTETSWIDAESRIVFERA